MGLKSINDKKANNYEYIKNEIGIETWSLIKLFEINALDTFNTISLAKHSIEDGNLATHSQLTDVLDKESDLIRLKQRTVLDIIMKLEILIEGILLIIDSFSEGYKSTPKKIQHGECFVVIDRIKNRAYTDFWKMLGLAPIESLDIKTHEKTFLSTQYQKVETYYYELLHRLADFYNQYYVLYLKGKHGLSLIPSVSAPEKDPTFANSSLISYAYRSEAQINRCKHFKIDTLNSPYFNTIVYLNFNDKLLTELKSITTDLQKIITFVCELHVIKGMNCGEGYIPVYSSTWYWPLSLVDDEYKTFDRIAQKISKNYNTQKNSLNLNVNSTRDDVTKSLQNEPVTILYNSP